MGKIDDMNMKEISRSDKDVCTYQVILFIAKFSTAGGFND